MKKSARGLRRFDSNVTPGHGVAGVRLDTDESRSAAAIEVGVVKRSGLLAHSGLSVGEKDRVIIGLHGDLIFKPYSWHERGTGRIILHTGFVEVQVPDTVARLDFNEPS